MTSTATRRHARPRSDHPDLAPGFRTGPLGRLGIWVTDHAKLVTGVWLLLIIGLGAFAPQVEHNLSGAGWQADGSESVAARELAREHFGGNASSAIQVVGIVLGVAVLLDATLVRLVLLPVLLRLTGKAAWYTPAGLKRVLPHITFAHD